jgi:hypothetical protein
MANEFQFDVFLSHSAKDKAVVRDVAARLQQDGVRVWLDEEQIPSPAGAGEGGRRPGEGRGENPDSIPAKLEAGLEHSRVLVLCMSANAFGGLGAVGGWHVWEAQLALSRPAEPGAPLHSPAARRRPHQRLHGAIPLHQLVSGRSRAGVWEVS